MSSTTLWKLPKQPLPDSDNLVGPVFVTLWFVSCSIYLAVFGHYLQGRSQFISIGLATLLLAVYYFQTLIDRFLHYTGQRVPFGYIVVGPIWQFFYIGSTLLMLWGTHKVASNQYRGYFDDRHRPSVYKNAIDRLGRFIFFVCCLLSFYYVILYIALAVSWMQFLSLNIIADVATKRTAFELAMSAFFFVFSLFTFVYSTIAVFGRIEKWIDNGRITTKWALWMATLFLLLRSFSQFVTAAIVYSDAVTRNHTMVATDIIYGLLTSLFFLAFWSVIRDIDKGKDKPEDFKSHLRGHVLKRLEDETRDGYYQPRPFPEVLAQIESNLEMTLRSPPFFGMGNDREMRRIAKEEIARMRKISFRKSEVPATTPIYDTRHHM